MWSYFRLTIRVHASTYLQCSYCTMYVCTYVRIHTRMYVYRGRMYTIFAYHCLLHSYGFRLHIELNMSKESHPWPVFGVMETLQLRPFSRVINRGSKATKESYRTSIAPVMYMISIKTWAIPGGRLPERRFVEKSSDVLSIYDRQFCVRFTKAQTSVSRHLIEITKSGLHKPQLSIKHQ